ncbi:hypothetical protein B0H12DRAFT_1103040, partial [Mycena haematopus]
MVPARRRTSLHRHRLWLPALQSGLGSSSSQCKDSERWGNADKDDALLAHADYLSHPDVDAVAAYLTWRAPEADNETQRASRPHSFRGGREGEAAPGVGS